MASQNGAQSWFPVQKFTHDKAGIYLEQRHEPSPGNHFHTAHRIEETRSLGDKPEDWNPPIGEWMVKHGQLT